VLLAFKPSESRVGACTEDNASDVLRPPETFASPVACLMHGQAYLANAALGRELENNEAVKVVCVRSRIATTPAADRGSIDTARELLTGQ